MPHPDRDPGPDRMRHTDVPMRDLAVGTPVPLSRAGTGGGLEPHPGAGVESAVDERPEHVVLFSRGRSQLPLGGGAPGQGCAAGTECGAAGPDRPLWIESPAPHRDGGHRDGVEG